jgi:chromosome segregation protein
VTRDGSAVVDDTGVALGHPDSVLERRAEHARLATEVEAAERARGKLSAAADAASRAAADARAALEAARSDEARAGADRRRAEDAERAAARASEAVARESAWHDAQRARLDGEVARLRIAVGAEADGAPHDAAGPIPTATADDASALAAWEARASELRDRRDRLVATSSAQDALRRDAEHRRARAEAAAAMAEERVARADRDAGALADRESALAVERERLRSEIAAATTAERAAREALGLLAAADATDRSRLSDAEQAASGARERLRAADGRLRAADHAELEARIGLDALREGVLVELAGMGELGLAGLGVPVDAARMADPREPADGADAVAQGPEASEAALAVVAQRWATEPPPDPPPASGQLARLRRRYHELGAANPFAVEEYAELKARLETLETQDADLRVAIGKTRELIGELDTMIADQFRTTFAALETAFERRFEQLFDGGFARLSLTDPSDLGSTGVEIVARPPGKKAQALAMLSGGERALTAVALLFAMLEVRPVPFCVLDEVDAALDEANIGRFAEALRSLAHQTQFIVITHNRGTIESADALYGVTVGDDSVSRVISLRLDEARSLAADRRPELSAAG